MKVILSSVDVACMLAAQWSLAPETVVIHGIDELTVEIPASLLGLTEPQQQAPKPRKPRATTTTTTANTPSRKEAKDQAIADDLKELEEALVPETTQEEPAPEEKDSLEQFMDDEEEAFN